MPPTAVFPAGLFYAIVPGATLCQHTEEEGPCFGPLMSPESRGPASAVLEGRALCANHLSMKGDAGALALNGPWDSSKPYYIAPNGIGLPERGRAAKPGDAVYVLFVAHKGGLRSKAPRGSMNEGMWVKVERADADRLYGTLANRPLDPRALHIDFGEAVDFPRTAVRKVESG